MPRMTSVKQHYKTERRNKEKLKPKYYGDLDKINSTIFEGLKLILRAPNSHLSPDAPPNINTKQKTTDNTERNKTKK